MNRASPRRRALTLVELMVVVVILGILATTVTLSVRDYLVSGKQNAARQEIAQIVSALELFYIENDRYPTNEEGLALLQIETGLPHLSCVPPTPGRSISPSCLDDLFESPNDAALFGRSTVRGRGLACCPRSAAG